MEEVIQKLKDIFQILTLWIEDTFITKTMFNKKYRHDTIAFLKISIIP